MYNPDLSAWYMVLALGVWTVFNLLIRFLLRFKHLRRLIKGDTVMIVQGGKINLKESVATASRWSSFVLCA